MSPACRAGAGRSGGCYSAAVNAAPHRPSVPLLRLALLALLMSCGQSALPQAGPDDAPARPPFPGDRGDGTLVVEGLLNGGFEWIADDTTRPAKYGAYWVGAFTPYAGDARDRIEERSDAAEGRRVLSLGPGDGVVHQKIVADPRFSGALTVRLAWRGLQGGRLAVALRDGPGRRHHQLLEARGDGWQRVTLDLGRHFARQHGAPPVPRLVLELACTGPAGARVEVDAVSAAVTLPRVSPDQALAAITTLAHTTLTRWLEPPERGGLGLVDPETGWCRVRTFHVETGQGRLPALNAGLHSIHTTLLAWLEIAEQAGWTEEQARWRPHLDRIVATLLERHFDPDTGLPRLIDLETGEAAQDMPVTVGAYVEFLARARHQVGDPDLAARADRQIRAIADQLLRLQLAHDLPADQKNDARLNRATGVFEGSYPNWFGHMPPKLTPSGALDTPRQYNSAWAIVKERSFWYHLLRSPAAVMAAHEVEPRPQDLEGVGRALSRYHRDWDAARYDLENDTDDHYGYLAEDLLNMLHHGGEATPARALQLLQGATDHRLSRQAATADETLWIQAIRLGTACAGDSPRAFKGVLDLYRLPPEVNPHSSGLPLYRDALLELAANDWKGRQLTNGQFTESFFRQWEMVCICFKGTYQGDCRERPLDQWDGDVGDLFGGPPMQGIEAQCWAYAVATPEERPEILARLATIRYVTDAALARPHGYLAGLDEAVARQYELPEKYILGLSPRSTQGLGYLRSWLHLVPFLLED